MQKQQKQRYERISHLFSWRALAHRSPDISYTLTVSETSAFISRSPVRVQVPMQGAGGGARDGTSVHLGDSRAAGHFPPILFSVSFSLESP